MLHEDLEDAHLLLLVLVYHVDALVVVGHFHGHYLGSVGWHLDASEEFLDLCLDMVYVHVADDDDSLVVWAIPFAVVGAQGLRVAAVDYAHQSDRHAVAILTARVELRKGTLQYALLSHHAHTVLIVHHVALVVDGFLGERDAVAPVFQDEHT